MTTLPSAIDQLLAYLKNFANAIFAVDGLLQFVLLFVLFGVAHVLEGILAPRMEAWIRSLSTVRARLRQLAVVLRHLRSILFALLCWTALVLLRAVTWPSHSYLIGVAANLATAWVVVSIASRLIRSSILAGLFQIFAWAAAALNVLGLTGPVVAVLDAAAITVGATRISALLVIKLLALMAATYWAAAFASTSIDNRLARADDLTPSLRVLIGKLSRIALFAFATMISLQTLGFDLASLAIFSGGVGVGIGFGLQRVVSNFVSGIILLADKSVKPGDVISVGDTFGWIETLGARYVAVVSRDGKEFLIPNEDLITHQVVNWSHSDQKVRLEVEFGVAYDSNPHQVRELAAAAAATPRRVMNVPPPLCHLVRFGSSSVDFVLRFWISDPAVGVTNIKGEVLLAVWDALKDNGISIPYPQRDLHIKGPVVISAQPASALGRHEAATSRADGS